MKRTLSMIAVLVFVSTFLFAPAALAHAGAHEEAGSPLLDVGLVAGAVLVVMGGAHYFQRNPGVCKGKASDKAPALGRRLNRPPADEPSRQVRDE